MIILETCTGLWHRNPWHKNTASSFVPCPNVNAKQLARGSGSLPPRAQKMIRNTGYLATSSCVPCSKSTTWPCGTRGTNKSTRTDVWFSSLMAVRLVSISTSFRGERKVAAPRYVTELNMTWSSFSGGREMESSSVCRERVRPVRIDSLWSASEPVGERNNEISQVPHTLTHFVVFFRWNGIHKEFRNDPQKNPKK